LLVYLDALIVVSLVASLAFVLASPVILPIRMVALIEG
jgi:hypothetical protein